MKIKRNLNRDLIVWKNSIRRKPLILQGVRQVGKTWLLKDFGRTEFENIAYFNFEEQPELKQFFQQTKDVRRLIQNMSMVNGSPIHPQRTLIILDEIQECNEALNSLKYFNENAPEYAVATAGSLLGVALSRGQSFPVGNVDFLTLHPITFAEFLKVTNPSLLDYLDQLTRIEPLPDIFFNQLTDLLRMFFISGGLPEPVVCLLGDEDVNKTQLVLSNIIKAYSLDFSKHIENKNIPKLGYIWNSIPNQLAKENKKFIYQVVKPGARAREYEDSLHWLVQAGLVYKIYRSRKPGLPIRSYDDLTAFKIYLTDVGVLRRLSQLEPISIKERDRLFTEFRGAFSENYILQSLVPQIDVLPRYWTSGNKAEIDFLIQYQNNILPIEVKSDQNIRGKSLSAYGKQFNPKLKIRYSLRNLKYDNGLLNIPLFMADYTTRIIDRLL